MNLFRVLALVPVAALLFSCSKTDTAQPAVCKQPTMLVAQAPCESGYADAVLLKASGYTTSPGELSQFDYTIYPQKDTLSSDLTRASYQDSSDDRLLIPLSKINDAPKFVVVVSMYCHSTNANPVYTSFAFLKRPTANPACYVWALQKQ